MANQRLRTLEVHNEVVQPPGLWRHREITAFEIPDHYGRVLTSSRGGNL